MLQGAVGARIDFRLGVGEYRRTDERGSDGPPGAALSKLDLGEQWGTRAACSSDRRFVGVRELQAVELMTVGCDDLDADRQAPIAEAGRRRECRAAGHRDEQS